MSFEVIVENEEVILPKDTVTLKANCKPPQPSIKGWNYIDYHWASDDDDKYPPVIRHDPDKPQEVQLEGLTEGVHNVYVEVTCSKHTPDEGDNVREKDREIKQPGYGKITVKSGNWKLKNRRYNVIVFKNCE